MKANGKVKDGLWRIIEKFSKRLGCVKNILDVRRVNQFVPIVYVPIIKCLIHVSCIMFYSSMLANYYYYFNFVEPRNDSKQNRLLFLNRCEPCLLG